MARFNIELARETEGLHLEAERVQAGVRSLLEDAAKGKYYVAGEEGVVIGQILVTFEWSDWRNGLFWWVQSVYVDRSCRGRGIFRGLFEHVRGEALRAGNVCGLRLYAASHNGPALKVYERLGLKETEYRVLEMDWSAVRGAAGL